MYDKPTTHARKSKELIELERLANADTIRHNRGVDQRFVAPRRFSENTANSLISCILTYIYLLDGTGKKSEEFNGVLAQFHGYSLTIRVDAGPGKAEFTERRETVEIRVHSFAQFKHFIDEL